MLTSHAIWSTCLNSALMRAHVPNVLRPLQLAKKHHNKQTHQTAVSSKTL